MTHKLYADSLRMVADFFEKHPEVELPDNKVVRVFGKRNVEALSKIPLRWRKEYDKDFDGSFALVKSFGEIEFRAVTSKEDVLEITQTDFSLVSERRAK